MPPVPPAPTPEALAAGFDFAHRLHDPAFRRHLEQVRAELGWHPDDTVAVVEQGRSVASVLELLDANGTAGCLLAVPDAGRPFGYRFVRVRQEWAP